MDEFHAGRLNDTLDFFILKRFSDNGPLSLSEVQRSAKPIHALLDLFARRKGKQRLETLLTVLRRLQREGWLRVEPQSREREESEIVYSLTTLGQQRVEAERVRQGTLLSQFIEEGDFDKSFQTFLDRGGSHAGN